MTGKTYTSFRKSEKNERPFKIVKIGLNRNRVTKAVDASLNVEAPVEKEAEVTFEEAIAQVTEDKAKDTKETAYIGDEETALSAPNDEKKSISPMVFAILGTLAVAILGALGYYLRGKNLNQE